MSKKADSMKEPAEQEGKEKRRAIFYDTLFDEWLMSHEFPYDVFMDALKYVEETSEKVQRRINQIFQKSYSQLIRSSKTSFATNADPEPLPTNAVQYWLGYDWNEIYKLLKDGQKEILDPKNHAGIWNDFIVYVPRAGGYGDESQTTWGNMLLRLMMTYNPYKIVGKRDNTWNVIHQKMAKYYTWRNEYVGGLGKFTGGLGLYGILWEHTVDFANVFFNRTSTLIGAYDDYENEFSLDFWGMVFKYSYIVTEDTEHAVPKVTVVIDNGPYACSKRIGLLQLTASQSDPRDPKYLLDDEWLLHNGLARRTIDPQTGQPIVRLTVDRKTGKIIAFFQPDTGLWIDLKQPPTDVTEEGMRTQSGSTEYEFWRRSASNDGFTEVVSFFRKNLDHVTGLLWTPIWNSEKGKFSDNKHLRSLLRGIYMNILGKPLWYVHGRLGSELKKDVSGKWASSVSYPDLLKKLLTIPSNELSRVTYIIDKASFMTEHLIMTQKGVALLGEYRAADMLNYNRWRVKTDDGKEISIDKTIDNLQLSSLHKHFGQYIDNLGFMIIPKDTISERPRDPDDQTMWLSKEKFDPAKDTIAFIDQARSLRDPNGDTYVYVPIWKSKSEQSLIDGDKFTITQDTVSESILFKFWNRDPRRPQMPISSCEQKLFSRIDSFLVYRLKIGSNGKLDLTPVTNPEITTIPGYDHLLKGSNVWDKCKSVPIALNDVYQGLKTFEYAHELLSTEQGTSHGSIAKIYEQLQGFLFTNPTECLRLFRFYGHFRENSIPT